MDDDKDLPLKCFSLKYGISNFPMLAKKCILQKSNDCQGFQIYKLLKSSLISSVHAQELTTESEGELEGKKLTSIEKMAASSMRPMIVVSDSEVKNYINQETGQDRLRAMFETSNNGSLSAEMAFVVQSTKSTSFITFMIASIYGARAAREKMIQKQKHQKFEHRIKAVRRVNDAVLLGGVKTGLTYALKTGLFVGIFGLTSQSIATYRNKSSVIEYTTAGMLTGMLSRFSLGPKGMIGGGFVGGVLGTIGGIMIYLLLTTANETFERRHYWYIHEKLKETKQIQQLGASPTISEATS